MLTKQIGVRVSDKFYKQFSRKARKFGRVSDLLRELMEAYVDERITITPNPDKEYIHDYRK